LLIELGGRYFSLDDASLLSTARSDRAAFVRTHDELTVIDEVQKAPELFPAIKIEVDRDTRPGRFLLTGSANVLVLPRGSESLAGRTKLLPLRPFAQDELANQRASFSDALFSSRSWRSNGRDSVDAVTRIGICDRIVAGGFPEAVARVAGDRRDAWFGSYMTTLLHRDVRDIANIDGLTELPRLMNLLAARVGSLLNMAELSRSTGIAHTTLRRYLTLLEAIYVFQPLPAWSTNIGKRFVKSPKVHLVDTGLCAHLRGETASNALAKSNSVGPLLESFVVQEVRRQLPWSHTRAVPYHLRTASGQEVDLVLEDRGGRVAGVEVKATPTVRRSDFTGLDALAEASGDKFCRGVVLHLGDHAIPFGEKLWALPINELWRGADDGDET